LRVILGSFDAKRAVATRAGEAATRARESNFAARDDDDDVPNRPPGRK
jgi:hypothetical protein